ncbi:MAG: hypothetical protein VXX88_05505 [Pseudomonadota bacterium]|nr:hypothetical protein [Pseudomonadota bacterium]
MTNKLLLLPLLAFKLKTALAIKTGLSLFGLGLGVGCLLNSSSSGGESKVDEQTNSNGSPTKKARTGRKLA